MKKGLVIGKFYPLHKGHDYLIETALANCSRLDILVCDNEHYRIPGKVRVAWIKTLYPKTRVRLIRDVVKDDDSLAWAKHTVKFLGYAPDIVFTSEAYGDLYAKYMGAVHFSVDRQRQTVPISGTGIRQDVLKNWNFMPPIVRANYCLRVAVVGAESTGTTTLSRDLAKHYHTTWVPEFGRFYSEGKLYYQPDKWDSREFDFIAQAQAKWEDQMAGYSHGLLICDTNAFATHLWHERYMGYTSDQLKQFGTSHKPALYILTGDEIPFVNDGLRDGRHVRHAMQRRFFEELEDLDVPYHLVTGPPRQRKQQAIRLIDKVRQQKVTI